MTHTKDEALQMCLEYIETDAHERKYVRHAIKQALAAPTVQDQKSCKLCTHEQRHYMEMTGPCRACRFYSNFASATPPAAAVQEGRDWSLLEATQESLREHIAEIKRLKEAKPAVPDAITDDSESPEYRSGWNECREVMAWMMK